MNRTVKIVLIVVGVLLTLCLLCGIAGALYFRMNMENMVREGDTAEVLAQSIVDYTLPDSADLEETGFDVLGMKMVFLSKEGASENNFIIMLMEMPKMMVQNEDQMREQMQNQFEQQFSSQSKVNTEKVNSEQITINGKSATLESYEGKDESEKSVRQLIAIFEAKSGNPGILMIMGNQENWPTDTVGTFLNSIR